MYENEYKDTGWLGVSCSKDGKFMRNGKPKSIIYWHDVVPMIMCRDKYSQKWAKVSDLLAKAWCPDYYEGCYTIPKDGDRRNINIDNILCVSKKEFFLYRGDLMRQSKIPKEVDWSKYGVFKRTHIDGLDCTIDGVFRKNGRILKVYKTVDLIGRKRACTIRIKVGQTNKHLNAAKIVAQTWSHSSWFDDCMIVYKDGDKHNIHSDNLILVDEKKYYHQIGVNAGLKTKVDFDKSFKKIELRYIEHEIAYNYFKTGNLDKFNEYIHNHLLKELYNYSLKLWNSAIKAQEVSLESISILYEWVLAYRPISNYTEFCKRMIRTYFKSNSFGFYLRTPKKIDNVSLLNLDSLCKKFQGTKIK